MEFCEFGSSLTRCKEWLQKTDQALYDHFYSEGALLSYLANAERAMPAYQYVSPNVATGMQRRFKRRSGL